MENVPGNGTKKNNNNKTHLQEKLWRMGKTQQYTYKSITNDR